MSLLKKLIKFYQALMRIGIDLDKIRQSLGRIEKRQLEAHSAGKFLEYEFQVYSQWGEDGLIQHILSRVDVPNKIFIEFGVEDYTESNTRFLLVNNNWSGLVIDGSADNINRIKNDPIYWRHNLKAECAFIDAENIDEIIRRNGIADDIGLLSIDIDGNDYYVFEAIKSIRPRIIICEYNSLWGDKSSVSTPYDPAFVRGNAHYSNLYFGASITALTNLATEKGYSLVGSNSTGANIFFVRNDLLGGIDVVTPEEAYIKSSFRQSRDPDGWLTFLDHAKSLALLKDMSLMDFESGVLRKVRDLIID